MPALRSILCPVDFSEQSSRALLWASAIAQSRGGQLTVLHVIEPLLANAAGIRLGIDLPRTDGEPALRRFVETTLPEAARRGTRVQLEVTVGNPSDAILQTSRRLGAGLIVMGAHGLGGLRKLLLGSTTEEVLRRTEWPVLAVPAGAVSAPTVGDPGVQLNRILLATDFSQSATAAMWWASDIAADANVPLILAHVVEPVLVLPLWEPLVEDVDSDHVSSARRALAGLSGSLHNNRHKDYVVAVGPPADTIASLATEYAAGLVVMGLAHSGDADGRRPGSIAYRVLRVAHVAVVVVPQYAQSPNDRPPSARAVRSDNHLAQSRVGP